jgi:hypothetical protein
VVTDNQERQWAEEREAALERWIDGQARRIAALPTLEGRRAAIAEFKREQFRERLRARLADVWSEVVVERRADDAGSTRERDMQRLGEHPSVPRA